MAETLNARELAIIEARFGFDGDKRTLEALGKEHGRSRGQINVIEWKALRKLKGGRHCRRLYDALEVLGGHPRPSLRPGTAEWYTREYKNACRLAAERFARAQAKRHARMLELDAERQLLGDNPSYSEFRAFLVKWEQVSWTRDMETNAMINASDRQLHQRREGLIRAGRSSLAAHLTPERRDEARVANGLAPYPNQQPIMEWISPAFTQAGLWTSINS